jgi:hypothetical protein
MNLLAICSVLLLQSVISIRPGFVHFADGKTDVRKSEQLETGRRIETGPNSRVEIGLGPDAILRLNENSAAVLESLDKADLSLRLESGTALVEVEDIEKPNRIRVAAGDLKTVIDSKGVFRFSDNAVFVIDGRLAVSGNNTTVQKGWQVADIGGGGYKLTRLILNTPQVFKSFLNSPRAGFVNATQGDTNVRAQETVKQDQTVQTGSASYVELLLRPGAFLRIDENSSVVLESVSANDVVVRVVSGSALIENVVPDERLPIRVNIGGTKAIIASTGLYRITNDTASVLEGVVRFGKNGEAVFSGMQVKMADKVYDTKDLEDERDPGGLDIWSAERSQLLATANFSADYADSQPNFFLFLTDRSYNAAWVYSPSINGITFMPQLRRESHYGTSFVPLYSLLPPPSMLPPGMVRGPNTQPSLPAVTPSKESSSNTSQPASTTTTPAPASPNSKNPIK